MRALLNSSVLASVVVRGQYTYLTFRNGAVYRYVLGQEVIDGLIGSESAGQYFNDHIRYAYRGERVSAIAADFTFQHRFQSSFLGHIEYDIENEVATITMRSGATYLCEMVIESFFDFIRSESAGSYFNSFIRGGGHLVRV